MGIGQGERFRPGGEVAERKTARQLIEEERPDVAVLEGELPGMDGPAVVHAIRSRDVPTQMLAFSAHADDKYITRMLQAGARGYVLKEEAVEVVLAAVRAIASGGEWYSLANIYGKMQVRSRAEAVALAWKFGLA